MSTVDINYGNGMGSYRAIGGGNRAERRTGRKDGQGGKTGETKESGTGRGAEVRKEAEKSSEGDFGRRMVEKQTAAAESAGREKQPAPAAGSAEKEKQPAPAAGSAEGEKTGSVWWEAAAGQEAKSPRDMSLDEYMNYIYGIISELSRKNYSRGNSVFIYISEEGFRAMQNDPEYEAWVMDNIRQAYNYCGSRGGHDGYHSAHFFGATKEEYQGQSWHSGCSKCEQERRRERKLRQKKKLEALLKKRRERKLLEQRRLAKLRLEKAFYKKLLAKRRLDHERLEAGYREDALARKKLEEGYREESLARREAATAFRMYQAIAKYTEQ